MCLRKHWVFRNEIKSGIAKSSRPLTDHHCVLSSNSLLQTQAAVISINNYNYQHTTERKYNIMSQALQSQPELITLEQYEALAEEQRAEVFDGIVHDMAGPSQIHQRMLLKLSAMLDSYVERKKGSCLVIPSPFDVILSEKPLTIVQPDIMIICDKDRLDGNRCNGAPDFIIEIVSPGDPSDDYIRKAYYYKKYDVREYWIVDPKRRMVTVNYFEEDLINVVYSFDATIKVNIYDDLYISFPEIARILNI